MKLIVCPTESELAEFSIGNLAAERIEEVADHLDSCTECASRLAAASRAPDPLAEAVRQAGGVSPFGSEAKSLPATLRDYRLEDVLGEGGMGTVYRAMHMRLGRPVALKVLTARRRLDPEAAARFEREMRAIGGLRHPNIVQPTDAGEIDGVPFLAMELLEGCDLARLVNEHGPLKTADACEAIRQAALGLQHAHEHGLVHRDVKPSNLMLTPEGTIKLLDLGLARMVETSSMAVDGIDATVQLASELTSTNARLGTASYMAPEQRTAPERVDARADLYALSRTLCYLLTGSPQIPSASSLPAKMTKVLRRLQDERPEDRYPNAAAVVEAIGPWARGHDIGALVGRSRAVRGRRFAIAIGSLAVLVIVGGTALGIYLRRDADSAIQDPSSSGDSGSVAEQAPPPSGRLGLSADEAKSLQRQWAVYLGQGEMEIPKAGLTMQLIPPGEMNYGDSATVTISKAYWLGRTEVTRAQFRRFVEATEYVTDVEKNGNGMYHWTLPPIPKTASTRRKVGRDLTWRNPGYANPTDDEPVSMVSWNDADSYCQWLSKLEGKRHRLPTSAEFVWASRAGVAAQYPSGKTMEKLDGDKLEDFAWTSVNSPERPQPVGRLRPNAWGLFDMIGNVAEWCQNWRGPNPTGRFVAAGPETGTARTLQGGQYTVRGGFDYPAAIAPSMGNSTIGFRVLREP